jgi:hypothetical protein
VLETSTSPGAASAATRAPVWTAIPATLPSTSSHSPVCRPARTSMPSARTLSTIAHAQRMARAGPASIQFVPGHRLPPSRNLNESRAGNLIGHVARAADRGNRVLGAVDDQYGDPDRGQHVPHVDLAIHQLQRLERARTRGPPVVVGQEPDLFACVVPDRANHPFRLLTGAKETLHRLALGPLLLLRLAPGIVGRPQ